MSVFKTYKVNVTFHMATVDTPYSEELKNKLEAELLYSLEHKIRVCLSDTKNVLFTNPNVNIEWKPS